MSQAQVDNFVRKLQKLQGDSAKLRGEYKELEDDVITFCNDNHLAANLLMSLLTQVDSGKIKASDVFIDVTVDNVVTVGLKCEPTPKTDAEEKEVTTDAE
jgi:hypothetical protein